jgi:hypothetical protein
MVKNEIRWPVRRFRQNVPEPNNLTLSFPFMTHSPFVSNFSYDSLLLEFTKKYMFGFSIASSFLNLLHVPLEMSFEEMANTTLDLMIKDAYTRGGESVNKELRGMIYEIYKLHEKFGLKLEL